MPITRYLIFCAIALSTLPTTAQGLDVERARSLIEDILYVYAPRDGSPFALTTTGKLQFTKNGLGQDVELPDLTLMMYGVGIELGDVTLSLQDEGNDQVTMNAILPSEFTVRDTLGYSIGAFTLESPQFVGVWNHSLFAFNKLDARASNLIMTDRLGSLTIRHLAIASTVNPTEPQRWQSENAIDLVGVQFYDQETGNHLTTDLLKYEYVLRNVDLGSLGAMVQATRFNPLSIWPRTQLSEQILYLAADFYDIVAIDAQEMSLEVSSLQFTEASGSTMLIAEMILFSHWANLASDLATFEGGVRLAGITVDTPQLSGMDTLIPTESSIRVNGGNLPLTQLLRALSTFARQSDVAVSRLPDITDPQLMLELQRLLSDAGAELRIVDGEISAPAASVNIEGTAVADANTVAGVVASLTLEFVGLDHITGIVMGQGGEAAGAAMVLLILQGLGEPITLTDGMVAHRYVLTLDGDGLVRLNGTDVGPLIQSLQ